MSRFVVSLPLSRAAMLAVVVAGAATAAERAGPTSADFLATWNLDRAARAALEQQDSWNDTKLQLCLRLLARLKLAPPDAAAAWAVEASPATTVPMPGDTFVRFEGRALFVSPLELSAEQAEIANRPSLDVVRMRTLAGLIDVVADAVPRAWPRRRAIDEPATAIGLVVSNAAGPQPPLPAADAPSGGPTGEAAALVVAPRVAWNPPTPLGGLGMDYGLFDTVVDGQRLVAGDTDAFYAMLAAVGRGTDTGIEGAAGPAADAVPIIDPGQRWFESHRGDPVTVQGTARHAIRIQIDEPRRRREIGGDHYWELFVFVPTSLIKINGRLQETYPIVCCVRDLPAGMPTGQVINEPVRVSGFAMKRYSYPPRGVQGQPQGSSERQESPLLVARRAVWLPERSTAEATSLLGWVFLGLAGLIGAALAYGAWRINRDARLEHRRQRAALPDKVQLP